MNNDILYETQDRSFVALIILTTSISIFVLFILAIGFYSSEPIVFIISIIVGIPNYKDLF